MELYILHGSPNAGKSIVYSIYCVRYQLVYSDMRRVTHVISHVICSSKDVILVTLVNFKTYHKSPKVG